MQRPVLEERQPDEEVSEDRRDYDRHEQHSDDDHHGKVVVQRQVHVPSGPVAIRAGVDQKDG